jgi:squalene-hopene/tetraprenyl-beta-curcumene cyclase
MTPRRFLLGFAVLVLACAAPAQEPRLTPNKPDEPKAAKFSLHQAGAFMDEAALAWTRKRNCGSCHTNYIYLWARPSLKEAPTAAEKEVRAYFEKRATNWDTDKPRFDAEVVCTATTLALHDAATTGKLHPTTKLALDRMWTLQRKDGAWNWLKCGWPPMEHDDYFGATMAAVGVGNAPEGYASGDSAKEGVAKLKKYFADHPAPDLHHKAMLLWASQKLDGLMTKKEQQATIEQLLAAQRPDGGWALASLGTYKRHDKTDNPKDGPSDGYGTGLVIHVLRQAGVPAKDERIQAGVAWLKANQRESGRWFTRSLSNDEHHYIAHAGTSYAVLALRECNVPVGD